jgi:hypothetical protein
MIKAQLKFCPDLRMCELEDRLVPVIPNMGVIVLTPGGFVLLGSLPSIVADPSGAPGGIQIPTLFEVADLAGISGMQPGSGTGAAGESATARHGSNGGAAATIFVGSGANDSMVPIIPLVTRNTIANDAPNAAPLIGRVMAHRSVVLPPGQDYRGGVATEVDGLLAGQDTAEGPVKPLPIRLRSRPHRLASDASAYPVMSDAARAP